MAVGASSVYDLAFDGFVALVGAGAIVLVESASAMNGLASTEASASGSGATGQLRVSGKVEPSAATSMVKDAMYLQPFSLQPMASRFNC